MRKRTIMAAITALVLVFAAPRFFHSQTAMAKVTMAATPKPTPIPIVEPNVYVREILGPEGWLKISSYQYAGDGKWDDCDSCASALELSNGAYKLTLKRDQILKRGSYRYRTLKGDRLAKFSNRWNGKTTLPKSRGNTYISMVFFAYYDPDGLEAEKGLSDPTA
jgi:hypothetical protein